MCLVNVVGFDSKSIGQTTAGNSRVEKTFWAMEFNSPISKVQAAGGRETGRWTWGHRD